MKGLAGRKLSRTSSHRLALVRNLVISLVEHERISTTVAKAREAQRAVEKIVTKAKRGLIAGRPRQTVRAQAFVFNNENTMTMLNALAERYRDRTGGYTRLHLHGNRPGDNAPRALLEFVDRPEGDLKLEMTAMSMARELYLRAFGKGESALMEEIKTLGSTKAIEVDDRFQELSRINAEKVLRFSGDKGRELLTSKVRDHFYRLVATRQIEQEEVENLRIKQASKKHPREAGYVHNMPRIGTQRRAGMRRDVNEVGPEEPVRLRANRPNSVIRIGKGAFASRSTRRVWMPSSGDVAAKVNEAKDRHR